MSGEQIKAQIIRNNKIIEQEARTGVFTLSKKAQEAIEENKHLRAMCHHEFDDLGYCIYCDYNEKEL